MGKIVVIFALMTALMLSASVCVPLCTGQQPLGFTVGKQAPTLKVDKLLQAPPDAAMDWQKLKGKAVIIEFWAAWCAPCVAAIPHLNELAGSFANQPVVFIAVTDDPAERLESFLKTTPMKAWIVVDSSRADWPIFNVASIPTTVIVGPDGRVVAETQPEYVTAEVLRDVLAGKAVKLPSLETTASNLEWDQEEIDWKDGVEPVSEVIIKPIRTATSAGWLRPEGDRLTADGASLEALVQLAYQTDHFHLDWRIPYPDQGYRVAARVPKGREPDLLPMFQSALIATFGIRTNWQQEEKDVYVLRVSAGGRSKLKQAASDEEPLFESMRGKATARRQPLTRLCHFLANTIGVPVVDETGLAGEYDWDLPYQPQQPNVTLEPLRDQLGLQLVKARRSINMLVVDTRR